MYNITYTIFIIKSLTFCEEMGGNMMKKVLLGTLLLSSALCAAELSSVSGETTAIFAKKEKATDKPLIYLANNFHEMATLPGFTLMSPSGLVSSYGVIFAGLSGLKDGDNTDGAFALGMGFGDSNSLGGAVSLGIGSVDPRDGGSFNRGTLNLNVGHHFKEYGFGWSVGMTGLDLWHATKTDGDNQDPSFYTAVTKLWANEFIPIAITAGFGNNSYSDINVEKDRKDEIDGFGAVAFYLIPQVSLIVDYTSNVLSAGFGVVPFPDYPISMNIGATNINEEGSKDVRNKVAFVASIAAAYVF